MNLVNRNRSKNCKGFWITKNGRDTGILQRICAYEVINNNGKNINNNNGNDILQQKNIRVPQNNNNIKINWITGNQINNEDEN